MSETVDGGKTPEDDSFVLGLRPFLAAFQMQREGHTGVLTDAVEATSKRLAGMEYDRLHGLLVTASAAASLAVANEASQTPADNDRAALLLFGTLRDHLAARYPGSMQAGGDLHRIITDSFGTGWQMQADTPGLLPTLPHNK